MSKPKIALQTWTIRQYLKSEENILELLRQIKSMGYNYLELGGVGRLSPIEFQELLAKCKLNVIGLHEPSLSSGNLDDLLEEVKNRCNVFKTKFVTVSWDTSMARTYKAYTEYASLCVVAAQKLNKENITLCYHCFDFDLRPLAGHEGKTGLDIIMEETLAEGMLVQFDTFFIERVRYDLKLLLDKYGQRCKLVHLDDIDNNDYYAPLGEGRIPWPDTITAFCDSCSVKYFIVEHETNKPLEWIRISHDFWEKNIEPVIKARDCKDAKKIS